MLLVFQNLIKSRIFSMEEIKQPVAKVLKPNGGYPMHTFEDVKELFYPYIHKQTDRDNILKAYNFAAKQHAGIFRKSGEPYVQHLIEVAYICAQLQAGPVTIEAAFLHDVVEDTNATIEDIEAEDHRKICLGMARDVRVIIIK